VPSTLKLLKVVSLMLAQREVLLDGLISSFSRLPGGAPAGTGVVELWGDGMKVQGLYSHHVNSRPVI